MKEEIVETKQCKYCNISFEITEVDLEFLDKFSPRFGGKKFQIPTSGLCSECREQSRLLWRNERSLYKRECDATGKPLISVYSPDKAYKVYNREFWWSDKWNALDFGQDFDFNKSFFEQFKELFDKVPQQDLIGANNENSPFCHLVADNKNCYLIFESSNNENCYYGYWLQKCSDCVDCSFVHGCEKCYESTNCINCYNSNYMQNCVDCTDSTLLRDCIGCENCFASTNLINKKYHIFNKEFSKQEYFEEIKKLKNDKEIFNKFSEFDKKSIKKSCDIINSTSSTGNHITNSKNCKNTFQAHDAEDCRYCGHVWRGSKNCMDSNTAGRGAQLIYYSLNCGINVYNLRFCNQCWECSDMMYSSNCNSCKNCFGSVGLVNKEYCIFNKQYTKHEYDELVSKIIEYMQKTAEWGEFFPAYISPFGYNETVAQLFYLLKEDEINKKGFKFSTYENPFPKVEKIIPADKLPEYINDIPDDILNWAIECAESKKPFRIIKEELDFYRKQNLPIPKKHPDIRHENRIKIGNPTKLFDRTCDKCQIDIKSIYEQNSDNIVYCEKCYNKEIY